DVAADTDRVGPQVVAGYRRLARGRFEQRPQQPRRGRLAGPVRAEEADHLAGLDVDVDAAHGMYLFGAAAPAAERPYQSSGVDHADHYSSLNSGPSTWFVQ